MRRNKAIPITPAVLRWARERAGYTLEDIQTDFPQINKWEKGEAFPTYKQLEKVAKKFDCTIAVFFFPEPPDIKQISSDFRTLPESEIRKLSPKIIRILKKAKVFQYNISELMELTRTTAKPALLQKIDMKADNIETSAQKVRNLLEVSIEEQQKWTSSDQALKIWRDRIEEQGIFVFKDAFRDDNYSGFCLYDSEYPIIYLNNSNSKNRQIFTLFHELAHLLFETSGIETADQKYTRSLRHDHVEVLCNEFAANVLVPSNDFSKHLNKPVDSALIDNLARLYCVSREAILRRYLNNNKISPSYYQEKVEGYLKEYQRKRKEPQTGKSGGNYHATQGAYLCRSYTQLALNHYYNDRISPEQLGDYLNIKVRSLEKFESQLIKGYTG